MDFQAVIEGRRSVRYFKDLEVSREALETILRTANQAPSAGNLQAYEIVVVQDAGQRLDLSNWALGQRSVAEAPVVLVFCGCPERSAPKYGSRSELYAVQDATIACAHAQLAASALGLATCWIGAFQVPEVSRIVRAPEGTEPVAMLVVGHGDENPPTTARRSLDDLVMWDTF